MKLTSKQINDLMNCHCGVGSIIMKNDDNEIYQIEFYVGKNKKICALNDKLPAEEMDLNQVVLERYNENAKW